MLLKESVSTEARDPSVIYHNGSYYHCFASGFNSLCIAKASAPGELISAEPVKVYTPEENTAYSKELWAPELHVIDGKCYIYVACDDGDNYNHRMYVLENGSSDPLAPYKMAGKLSDSTDKWAIDGTVFKYGGQLYTVWSGWEGDINVRQNLYIAKMSDPRTISSERVMISTPEYDWEMRDCIGDGIHAPFINEGPFAYERDGELMLLYSASGSWANHYCIGIIRLKGENLLDPASWEKQDFPALSLDDGYNGPGHCSVFSDGACDYIAFHTYDEGHTKNWNCVHAIVSPFEIKDGKIIIKK
ncbi:MAG: glycoside hydrolase family 43 protein [Clostridia bacterium]|nr:glycoside hydrolase family 43 protein [Clostridia bacterium]